MPLNSTIATYDGHNLRSYSYALRIESCIDIGSVFDIGSLHDLLTICRALEVDTLWIVPGSQLSRAARYLLPDNITELLATAKKENKEPHFVPLGRHDLDIYSSSSFASDGTPRFLLIKRAGGSKQSLRLAFPEHDDRWPWRRCEDGYTLLKSLLYLQDTLQCEIAWSPGRVGQGLMLSMNSKHPSWLAAVELPDTVKNNMAVDMRWHRPLAADEKEPGMYLHLFDGNSKYLASCTSAYLGEGAPEYFESHAGDIDFDPRRPGLWHILAWDRWVWTPELEYLFAGLKKRPLIHDAYLWMDAHQALRSWGEHMWKARCELKERINVLGEPCELAYEAIKLSYVQALGWLTFDRPDHWSMIGAGAVRSTGFKKRQLAQQGIEAVYWKADMLGFVSRGPGQACYRSMYNRAGLLGGYKHVASGPLTEELAQAFDGDFSAADKALSQWREIYE